MNSPVSPRYQRPPLSLIEADLPGFGIDLYVGGSEAAADPALLAQHGIRIVVNCAVNLDINLVETQAALAAGRLVSGSGAIRYYKLGLVDDAGNPDTMLLAGYYLLRGALEQRQPERPSYPLKGRGNVLVNCRAGRSRSVVLAALFLHVEMPQRFATLDTAIAHVRERRQLHPDEWFETPKPELARAARHAAAMIAILSSAEIHVDE